MERKTGPTRLSEAVSRKAQKTSSACNLRRAVTGLVKLNDDLAGEASGFLVAGLLVAGLLVAGLLVAGLLVAGLWDGRYFVARAGER